MLTFVGSIVYLNISNTLKRLKDKSFRITVCKIEGPTERKVKIIGARNI